jgi:uncharacterized membrane protein (DUF485 family)
MSWLPKTQQPEKHNTYRILLRLQFVLLVGFVFIVLYSFRSWSGQPDGITFLESLGVGIVGAGASLLAGFLLGFVFCIPRTPARHDSVATPPAGKTGTDAPATSTTYGSASAAVETNSNLVEISDWLTKIIVGVGLVELSKIPGKLDSLAKYFAAGLRTCSAATTATTTTAATASTSCADSTKAFAMGIIILFSTCGFLFGYLWTRLYWQRALIDLDQVRVDIDKARAWVYISLSRLYTGIRTWRNPKPEEIEKSSFDLALRQLDNGLKKYPDYKELHLEKAYVLAIYAANKAKNNEVGSQGLLENALDEAKEASELDPDDAIPLYDTACYLALLHRNIDEVLKALGNAIAKNRELKEYAKTDTDLESVWQDPKFKALVG